MAGAGTHGRAVERLIRHFPGQPSGKQEGEREEAVALPRLINQRAIFCPMLREPLSTRSN